MQPTAVIVIGAGAAGLMAARTLAKAGKKVIVLEARNRTGGRIHTLGDNSFFKRAELGAEFIHGDLPLTQQLLNEANISFAQSNGEMHRFKNGHFEKDQEQIDGWDALMQKLQQLETDTDIDSFLEQHFSDGKHQALKDEVRRFVAGFDSADPKLVSAFSLRREWAEEDWDAQYRIPDGYCTLINFLSNECKAAGGEIILSAPVVKVSVDALQAVVTTADNTTYHAEQVVVALPLGVLQVAQGNAGAITFEGVLPGLFNTFHQIGFGSIIKILVQFDKPFWQHLDSGKLSDAGFFLSAEEIPTWWTQHPDNENALLTGWLGGPGAKQLEHATKQEIWEKALQSLSNLFKMPTEALKSQTIAWQVVNWTADPFTRGSYAYDTVHSAHARKTLSKAIGGKLCFAGEYLYDGPAMGTVEAALQSGLKAAETILAQLAPQKQQEVAAP